MPLSALSLLPPNFHPRSQSTHAPPLTPFMAARSIPSQDNLPTSESPVSVPEFRKVSASLSTRRMGSSAHLSVTRIRLYLVSSRHPSLPNVEISSSQPPLLLSLMDSWRCALSVDEIFSIVSLSCDLGAVFLYQVSWRISHQSYLVHFSITSYIGCNSTQSATVFCWRLIYSQKSCVPVSLITFSTPSLFHVPYHCHYAVFTITFQSNPTWNTSILLSISAKSTHFYDPKSITAWITAL